MKLIACARKPPEAHPLEAVVCLHSVDALCNLTIMTGAGLCAYIRLDVALFALLGYFMLCMYVFLYNQVSQRFQLSFLALGPTELRVGLIVINCWMYFAGDSRIAIGRETFSPYDLVLCGAGIVFVSLRWRRRNCLFLVQPSAPRFRTPRAFWRPRRAGRRRTWPEPSR
jgi:hypothetical protein